MKDKSLFIVAQGRSGSSLLLRLLNSIDGCHICGENHNAMSNLSEFYFSLLRSEEHIPQINGRFRTYSELSEFSKNISKSNKLTKQIYSGYEWYNVFDKDRILASCRAIALNMFNPSNSYKVWGFKEIRFGIEVGYKKFERDLDFLRLLSHESKIIFLTRDIEQLLKSAWWAEAPEKSMEILTKQRRKFERYYAQNLDSCYWIQYSDLVDRSQNLLGMYEFIEKEFCLDTYQRILERK